MSSTCMMFARMALVMEILPAGTTAKGLPTSALAAALARRGINVHRDTLLRNLKEWRPMLGLVVSEDESGTLYWKRGRRQDGFAHLLDLDNLIDDSSVSPSNNDRAGGMAEHDLPDWPLATNHWGRGL